MRHLTALEVELQAPPRVKRIQEAVISAPSEEFIPFCRDGAFTLHL
jgi:hypothetical protein